MDIKQIHKTMIKDLLNETIAAIDDACDLKHVHSLPVKKLLRSTSRLCHPLGPMGDTHNYDWTRPAGPQILGEQWSEWVDVVGDVEHRLQRDIVTDQRKNKRERERIFEDSHGIHKRTSAMNFY